MNDSSPALTGLYSCRDVGVIQVAGRDARSFLQNLGTNDLRPLTVGGGCELFFANPKARAIAHAAVFDAGDDRFFLTVEGERTPALYHHLDRHWISEQVEITPLQSEWSVARLLGPESANWTGVSIDALPWHGRVLDPTSGASLRRQGALQTLGFDIVGPAELVAQTLADWQRRGAAPMMFDEVETLRIEAGWPKWGQEIDENRFVVELGRISQAISYAKGCYLGQEPIVMARDRGQANRLLMGFHADGPIPMGARVMKGEIELFRATSSISSTRDGRTIGLAFVYRGEQTPGATFTIPGADGTAETRAKLSSLPMRPE